jgi:hypothetical protein
VSLRQVSVHFQILAPATIRQRGLRSISYRKRCKTARRLCATSFQRHNASTSPYFHPPKAIMKVELFCLNLYAFFLAQDLCFSL